MSIEAVVGRIDQILAMQQELVNPTSMTPAASSTAGVAPASAGTTTSFTDALASAQAVGPASTSAFTVGSGGPQQVQAMISEADSLLGKPYVYGGHDGWDPSSGYDCSGFVSAVLHAGGYLSEPVDTTALPSQPGILPGPGQYVTIYDRALSGENGHVIIEIDGQFYESGGEAGPWGGGGGVEKIGQPSAAYLATFPNVLHPSGL
jgi:hypothetical protein